ncbi:hypothetical protein LOTGIDRAFT_167964 [Lottia gigantea]|uniref:Sialin n=1 Tax=Lottia gigantea TaxID=225164 RepID=V3ZLK4_LOTGI|nr:hypothetical protein LOTGIDRAFT_167964 [Lottia gigantea]ESO85177.1 hypothetical protein LOTGIDRAFT_167964 [Lottia gigantea]
MEKYKDDKDFDDAEKVPCCTSKRWLLAFVGFAGFFCMYALRVNISVAIVCMVKPDNTTNTNQTLYTDPTCEDLTHDNTTHDSAEFEWDKTEQSGILASYFYGYIVTQIPGGWLAGRYGGKKVIGFGLALSAMLNALTPVAARYDLRIVTTIRVLLGIFSGVMFPAMHSMWGQWSPPSERSRLTSFTYSGTFIGNIITFAVSGLLCAYGFDNGWGSIFYLTSIVTIVWLFFWFFLVSDTPSEHPSISNIEKKYIIEGVGKSQSRVLSTPWLAIAKSRAMHACLVAHFCNNWIHYTLLTGLPSFMKEALKFDIKQNGVLSAVPYMAMTISVIVSGQTADFLRRKYLSTKTTRKLFQISAFIGAGGCLVGAGFVTCENRMVGVALLTLAVTFEGMCFAGYMVNQVDFAPRYAGVLFGINNCIATIPGMIAPIVVGALTPNKSQEEWRIVFYVCGGFCLLGAVVFGFFARTDLEPWAVEKIVIKVDDNATKEVLEYDNQVFEKEDVELPDGFVDVKL